MNFIFEDPLANYKFWATLEQDDIYSLFVNWWELICHVCDVFSIDWVDMKDYVVLGGDLLGVIFNSGTDYIPEPKNFSNLIII